MRYPTTPLDTTLTLTDGLSAEAFYGLPEEDDGYREELVAGQVIREPMPGFVHGATEVRISRRVAEHAERHGLGEVVTEAGFVLQRNPDTVRGPDVAFVSAARLDAWRDRGPYVEGAPDLAVEVRSPSNTRREMQKKVEEYLAAGGREVWVVDPDARRITVHRPGEPPHELGPDDTLDGGDLLPGLTVPVAELFAKTL